ncbi:Arachidonate 5-lipoxygenase-activating protein [Labeo rohita]|uniref:Arachidonate 5-lipoxygenase-activating protein n=1 Tax=Labeo rohita TaxID=84645 RepID=A0ABQ8MCL3_LABRO|nr:Arachidonate 5-lipoxygenase-activating protein [Labeo rohita]
MIRHQSETDLQFITDTMFVAVMDNIFLLVLVTLLSVVQNVFFALKVEKECTGQHSKQQSIAFERLSCANILRNFMSKLHGYVPHISGSTVVRWCLPQPSTPGFLFGKRILFFLSLMCVVGIINHLMLTYGGSDYKEYIQTITKAASTLLLLP